MKSELGKRKIMDSNPDLGDALEPVAKAFNAINVNYYVAGSVASSFHGAARSTMDVDLVADLKAAQIDSFIDQLEGNYYFSKTAIADAISRKSCFNLIYLPTSFKVDIFIQKDRPFDINAMSRAKLGKIDGECESEFPIASAEDSILSKLEWYRLGDETSKRQWDDVVRVMKILGKNADLAYLKDSAAELNVTDLLDKLLKSIT